MFATLLLFFCLVAQAAPEETPLTLEQALVAADDRNLALQAIGYELDKADAQLSQAWGSVLPMASAGGSYRRADHVDEVDMGGSTDALAPLFEAMGIEMPDQESEPMVVSRVDNASAHLNLSVSLINPTAWSSIRVARRAVDLTELTIADTRQELLVGVAQAWYLALMSDTVVSLQEAQVTSATHHLAVAEARAKAGDGLRLDVIRAQTDLAAAKEGLLDAQRARETTRDTLGVLTGIGGLVIPVGEPTVDVPRGTDDELVSIALKQRSDLATRRSSLELAEAQLGARRAQFLPTVDLAWQGTWQITPSTDMGSDDPTRWNAIVSLNVPLYAHHRYAGLDEGRAARSQIEAQLRDAEVKAELAVRQARRDYETAVDSVVLA
ncbi:MAG: TolC family protein, partial [Proteobacteria bacterium]|nr:TolC family protein [Pseudomonadota bacterium]